jgi:hypothetical protein
LSTRHEYRRDFHTCPSTGASDVSSIQADAEILDRLS